MPRKAIDYESDSGYNFRAIRSCFGAQNSFRALPRRIHDRLREVRFRENEDYSPRSADRLFIASMQKAMCSFRSTPSSAAPWITSSR